MSRLFSAKELIKILSRKYGFEEIKIRGSHLKMRKIIDGQKITVIVPLHDHIKKGTLQGILRQAQIEKKDFLKN